MSDEHDCGCLSPEQEAHMFESTVYMSRAEYEALSDDDKRSILNGQMQVTFQEPEVTE